MARKPFYRFLDTVGDGSGTKDAAVDHSGAVEEYKLVPGEGEILQVERLIVSIADGGVLSADGYGALTALTNGIEIKKFEGATEIIDITDGVPIKTNGHWARFCYDVQELSFGGGDNYLNVRWTFGKTGVRVTLNDQESLAVRINDNLSNLSSHFFMVQGFYSNILQ